MKNVVIVSGHPDFKNSTANSAILKAVAQELPQAEIRKLDELYPDYQFDVKAEQAALEKADIIVFQYPMHWYSVPGILKLYIDKVMEHGWAYGSKGTALAGKSFIASLTTGAPEAGYSKGGVVGCTVEELSCGMEKFAALCKLDFKKLFYMCGALYVPGLTSEAQKQELLERAAKQGAALAECIKSL